MHINRRCFITRSLAAGAVLAAPALIATGCAGVTRHRSIPEWPPGAAPAGLDPDTARILYEASLAPSGHNSQPWQVRVFRPLEWIIAADPDRRLPAVDPDNREVMLSIGAFAENLSLAAGARGYRAEMELLTSDPFARDLIRVRLKKRPATSYPLQRLTTRMTAKGGYRPDDIAAGDVAALGKPLPGRLFYFPRGTRHAECMTEAAVESFRTQSYRDAAQKELVRWLRLSNAAARRHRDGLTTAGMEIHGFKGWFVRHFVAPEDFMTPSFREQGVDKTAALASQGGGWMVITGGSTVADLIDTGRRFERMALMARERGIAIHPMTQTLEETAGRELIAAHHGAATVPQFMLRVGYLDRYPDPVSLRRPLSAFVTAAG